MVDSLRDCLWFCWIFSLARVFCVEFNALPFVQMPKLMHELIFEFCKIVVDENDFIFGSIANRASFPSEINAINSSIEYQMELRNSICLCNIFRMQCKRFAKFESKARQ